MTRFYLIISNKLFIVDAADMVGAFETASDRLSLGAGSWLETANPVTFRWQAA